MFIFISPIIRHFIQMDFSPIIVLFPYTNLVRILCSKKVCIAKCKKYVKVSHFHYFVHFLSVKKLSSRFYLAH